MTGSQNERSGGLEVFLLVIASHNTKRMATLSKVGALLNITNQQSTSRAFFKDFTKMATEMTLETDMMSFEGGRTFSKTNKEIMSTQTNSFR